MHPSGRPGGLEITSDARREEAKATGPKASRSTTAVWVSTPVYALVWLAVFLIHLTTAVFVLVSAMAHFVLSLPTVHAATAALLIPVPLKQITGLSYMLVGVYHLGTLGRMVFVSIGYNGVRLRLSRRMSSISHSLSVLAMSRTVSTRRARRPISMVASVIHRVQRSIARVVGIDGYFGINGRLFALGLLLRELIEIALQSYQLWSLSTNVSRHWINLFAVVTVAVNCFSIPAVHLIFNKLENVERLMHLVVDMYLDFACAVVVPVCVLLPYLMTFDWRKGEFPGPLLVDDAWLSNAVAESRYVLVTSVVDYFASLLPQYSIYACLRLVKQIVRRLPTRSTRVSAVSSAKSTKDETPPSRLATSTTAHTQRKPVRRKTHFATRIVTSCIMTWGIVVASLHAVSDRESSNDAFPGCQLFVRPWFATKVPCSVLYVNCYRRNITGLSGEASEVLDQIETSVLTKVVFVHCPTLTIPANIVSFSNLGNVEIFNSTLVDWPLEASIRESTHPRMANVFIGSSNVSSIPPGLLHRELPKAMLAIGFTNSTLSELPANLGDLWATSGLGRIGLDGTQVQVIPASLARMKLRRLWISRSPIERIPDTAFSNSKPITIRMSGMPLHQLPERMGDTSALRELVVEYTNVSHLPAWAIAWLEKHKATTDPVVRSFFGSPECDLLNASIIASWRICDADLQSRYGLPPYSPGTYRYPL